MARVYNFSAGPAVLPEEVLREAADEMLDYQGSGQSVMEMSHRSKVYDNIIKEAEKNADRIVNESLSKARKIALDIEDLKKESKVFRTRFKMLVEAQLDMLNNDDWDHLMEYKLDSTDLKSLREEEESLA